MQHDVYNRWAGQYTAKLLWNPILDAGTIKMAWKVVVGVD